MRENRDNHPIEYLFSVRATVAPDRERVVTPVPEMLPGTAFFPGGPGLWLGESRSEAPPNWLPMPIGKVMVLGNDFSNSPAGHQEWLETEPYADLNTPTWRNLRPHFSEAGIRLEDCFFTNAYMGLRPESGPWGGLSPGAKDREFVQRCESFLDTQIEVQKPRLILALGKHAITFIARLSNKLDAWKPWPGFEKLDDKEQALISDVCFQGAPDQTVTVVALVHPSGHNMGNTLKNRRYRGETGKDAEIAMLKDALRLSGLEGNDE